MRDNEQLSLTKVLTQKQFSFVKKASFDEISKKKLRNLLSKFLDEQHQNSNKRSTSDSLIDNYTFFLFLGSVFIRQRHRCSSTSATLSHQNTDAILKAYTTTMLIFPKHSLHLLSSTSYPLHPLHPRYSNILLKYPQRLFDIIIILRLMSSSNISTPLSENHIEKIMILSDIKNLIGKPFHPDEDELRSSFIAPFVAQLNQELYLERQWIRISILITFIRANKDHYLQYSIFPLIPQILNLLDDYQYFINSSPLFLTPTLSEEELTQTIVASKYDVLTFLKIHGRSEDGTGVNTLDIGKHYLSFLDALYYNYHQKIYKKLPTSSTLSGLTPYVNFMHLGLYLPVGENFIFIYFHGKDELDAVTGKLRKIPIILPTMIVSLLSLLPLSRYHYHYSGESISLLPEESVMDMRDSTCCSTINEILILTFFKNPPTNKNFVFIEQKEDEKIENDSTITP